MAKRQTATRPRLSSVFKVEKSRSRLEGYLATLTANGCSDKQLGLAYSCWVIYPFMKELLLDSHRVEAMQSQDDAALSALCHVEFLLAETHRKAVEVLMDECERKRIESSAVWKSGHYCRELLADPNRRYYPRNRNDDYWPGCLGQTVHDLPSDVRESIMDGHSQVVRIGIKAHNIAPKRPPKNTARDNEFLRLSEVDLKADKDIVAQWNDAHPNENVSSDAVKKGRQRAKEKRDKTGHVP